ncbi:MAG: hypothetical protein LBV04_09720 [Deferribacteraceae bacterium]|jgi:hypothetical protein|nr:hypothetical protein [Deferribacteraceae bacterium]
MVINNANSPYPIVNSAAVAPVKAMPAPVKPVSTNMDTVNISAPAMEQYTASLNAQQPSRVLNPIYKNIDIDKDYGSWSSFKAKELFSTKPEGKDVATIYIPPTLQAKMDADPMFAAEITQRVERFLAEKAGDSYAEGKTISLTASLDANGNIGDRWTSIIWPELSATAVERYPQQAAAEAQATRNADKPAPKPQPAVTPAATPVAEAAQPPTAIAAAPTATSAPTMVVAK